MGIDKKLEEISRVTGARQLGQPHVQTAVQPPLVAQPSTIPLVHRADGFYDDIPWEEARYYATDSYRYWGTFVTPAVEYQIYQEVVPAGMVLDINSIVFRVLLQHQNDATCYIPGVGDVALPYGVVWAHDTYVWNRAGFIFRVGGVAPVDRRSIIVGAALPVGLFNILNQDVLHPQVGSHLVAREGQTVEAVIVLYDWPVVNLVRDLPAHAFLAGVEVRGRWIPAQYYNRMRQEFRKG